MAISGDTLKDFEFTDPESGNSFKVNLAIKDGIHLKLLETISKELAGLRAKP